MGLQKDMKSFYKKQPVAALVIGASFAMYAVGAFGYGWAGGKVIDTATGIEGYQTW